MDWPDFRVWDMVPSVPSIRYKYTSVFLIDGDTCACEYSRISFSWIYGRCRHFFMQDIVCILVDKASCVRNWFVDSVSDSRPWWTHLNLVPSFSSAVHWRIGLTCSGRCCHYYLFLDSDLFCFIAMVTCVMFNIIVGFVISVVIWFDYNSVQ